MSSGISISTPAATVHFSDISDSEVAASIIRAHRQKQPSARVSTRQPTFGVRRIRRMLNARLSDSETIYDYDSYASASDWEDDSNQPIVEFNWQARFIEVGSEFYQPAQSDRLVKQTLDDRTMPADRILRRVKKMEKEREQRRHERHERRRKREERSLELHNTLERGKLHEIRNARGSISAADESMLSAPSSPSHLRHEEAIDNDDNAIVDEKTYGQELSCDLWTMIDRSTRALLRKMDDFQFMNELESLLTSFKAGEPWSGSADNFRVINQSNESVELLFTDSFVRGLAEGSLPFHLMYHSKPLSQSSNLKHRSKSSSHDMILCIVKRRGFFVHHASLARHIQTYYFEETLL